MKKIALVILIVLLIFPLPVFAVDSFIDFSNALTQGHLEQAFVLMAEVQDLNQLMENGDTPLNDLIRQQPLLYVGEAQEPFLTVMLEAGADPNLPGQGGEAALHTAVLHDPNPQVLQILLTYGADVFGISLMGNTPFHLIGRAEVEDAVVLLEHGADINARNALGQTPLIMVISWGGRPALTTWLLENGADPALRDREGDTALHYAAALGNQDIIRILLETGAAVNSLGKNNRTPLDRAREAGHKESEQLLREHGGVSTGLSGLVVMFRAGWIQAAVSILVLWLWLRLVWKKSFKGRMLKPAVVAGGVSWALWGATLVLVRQIPFLQAVDQTVPLLSLTLLLAAVAGGSIFAASRYPGRWPDPLWAVLPIASLFGGVRAYPMIWAMMDNWLNISWLIRDFFLGAWIFSAGVFILPAIYKEFGFEPNSRKILKAAMLALAFLIVFELVSTRLTGTTSFFGLITLVVGGISAIVAIGVAIGLTALRRESAGGVLGLWGVAFWLLVMITWLVLGSPWFP